MINISDSQAEAAFVAEDLNGDIVVATSCSCGNPTRMFWFTPDEIATDISN